LRQARQAAEVVAGISAAGGEAVAIQVTAPGDVAIGFSGTFGHAAPFLMA
jgi:hypothetical protein